MTKIYVSTGDVKYIKTIYILINKFHY